MIDALMTEFLKARRSRVPWVTVLAFTVVSLVGGLFMFILQDQDRARSLGLIGTKAALEILIGHLSARRTGGVPDPAEPTGLLTHHLAHDAAAWDFVETLLERTSGHAGARWLDAAAIFAVSSGTGP